MIAALLIILACAVLNRLRGDDRWMPEWLRGRPLWYVAPAIGAIAALAHPWPVAAATAAAYLFWGLWPWGRWFDLGRLPDGYARITPPDPFERAIQALAFGSDHVALLLRHLAIVPGLVLVSWAAGSSLWLWSPAMAAGFVAAYEAAWRLNPKNPIWLAELAVGGLWGAAIVA